MEESSQEEFPKASLAGWPRKNLTVFTNLSCVGVSCPNKLTQKDDFGDLSVLKPKKSA